MARACLRREDELSQARTEKDFIVTAELGPHGILPLLYSESLEWKEA